MGVTVPLFVQDVPCGQGRHPLELPLLPLLLLLPLPEKPGVNWRGLSLYVPGSQGVIDVVVLQ
jgi:hypothetical protein